MISYNLAIGLAVFGSFLGSIASLNLKKGVDFEKFEIIELINKNLFLSVFIYGIASIISVIALSGAPYIVIFPITSTTWIWSLILSHIFLNEEINRYKVFGIYLIILGVILLI